MIKWIGYFRDELYNTLHKVEITHSYEQDKPRTITPIDGQATVGRGIYKGVSVRANSSTPTFPFKTEIKEAHYVVGHFGNGWWQVDLDAWVEDEYTFNQVNMSFTYECYPEERELMLAGESPVVINYEGEDNNIYKPCKYSSCTIKLITDWYDDDLYSKSIFDNKVTISYMTDEEYTILWEGYVTPNAYNQGFAYDIEDLQIECIDSLSALQYKEYEGTQSVVSAGDILSNTLKDFDHLYIQDNNYIGDVVDSEKQFEGYTILDYLTTDGYAYIDTGYYPSVNTYIDTKVRVNYENISYSSTLFGVQASDDAQAIGLPFEIYMTLFAEDGDSAIFPIFGDKLWQYPQTVNANLAEFQKIGFGYNEGEGVLTIGSQVNRTFDLYQKNRSQRPLFLFGMNAIEGLIDNVAGTSIGRFTITEYPIFNEDFGNLGSGTVVRDFYPVKRDSDGVLGMYDAVEGKFYTNANTIGDFIQGSPEAEGSDKTLSELKFTNALDIMKLQLSEYPFYNEDDEEYEKSNTLIEEICKFLGYTAVAKGRELWLLDYSNIKAPFSVYLKDDEGKFKFNNKISISSHKEWTKDDYFDDGTQFSLNSVYRKVSLQNDLDEFNDLTDSLFSDSNIYNIWNKDRYTTDKGSVFFNSNDNVAVYENEALNSKDTTLYTYKAELEEGLPIIVEVDNQFPKYYNGVDSFNNMSDNGLYWGCLLKSANLTYEVGSIPSNQFHAQTMGGDSEYIMLSTTGNQTVQDKPLISFKLNSNSIVQTTKAYYVINFSQMWSSEYFPCEEIEDFGLEIDYYNLYSTCMFKYGNLYWNGSNWQDTKCTFNIQLSSNGEEKVKPINNSFEVNNIVDYHTGLDLEGYIIPIPNGTDANVGSVEFSFMFQNDFHSPYIKAAFINNLSINLSFKKKNKDSKDDNEIEEVIDETYAEDKELDGCKFGTFDENHLCYNTVGYLYNDEYYIIKKVKWNDWICRPEEVRIYKYIIQYSHPRKQVDILLKGRYDLPYRTYENFNFGEIKFIQDSYELDLKSNTTQLKLVESRL